jgi:hypothetical protein
MTHKSLILENKAIFCSEKLQTKSSPPSTPTKKLQCFHFLILRRLSKDFKMIQCQTISFLVKDGGKWTLEGGETEAGGRGTGVGG